MDAATAQPVLPYAPLERPHSNWPAAILCLTGLGLILLAGCFLIGVLLLMEKPGVWQSREVVLASFLYVCCAGCFIAAAIVLVLGTRRALS